MLLGIMLLTSLLVQANTTLDLRPNSLPAPAWIQAVEITESKIKVEWAQVSGAVEYRVSRYDVTNEVQLPDETVQVEEYTSEPHDPGTTIQFEVVAIDENGEEGAPAFGEYSTSIIVIDDIASFSVPNIPNGGTYIPTNGSTSLDLPNADKADPDVTVFRVKLSYDTHFAEFLVWSHCIDPNHPGTRIQFYQESNWPASVSMVKIEAPEQGFSEIRFFYNQTETFFTLLKPSYAPDFDQAQLVIQNDLKSNDLLYESSTNIETNPCYDPLAFQIQEIPETLNSDQSTDGNDDASIASAITPVLQEKFLTVSPNPYHDAIKVEYKVAQTGVVRLFMTDFTGRAVQTIFFEKLESGTHKAFLTTNTLPAGMYLLTVQTESGCTSVPVVKH